MPETRSAGFSRIVVGATVAIFLLAVFAFRFVQQQFFPAASRPELIDQQA